MSSQKTLKVKRVFAWSIFNNLKKVAPKEFPTVGEIRSTITTVLPALREHVTAYVDMIKLAEDLAVKLSTKEISEEEVKAGVDKANADWKAYNKEHGNEVVDVVLDEEGLKTLRAQFDRENWGKNWVVSLEEFGELSAALSEAAK